MLQVSFGKERPLWAARPPLERIALLVALLFVGITSSVRAQSEPVELRIWAWTPGTIHGDIFARYIEEFHQEHPDIRIVVERGSNEGALLVAFAGGVAPDLVQGIGPWATALGPRGILLPLDEFIDGPDGVPREAFVDDLWSFSVVDGNTYQLAVDSNERALFVSVDAAEMAGIDPYEPPRDWNDLLDWARKMTVRAGNEVSRWGFDMHQENGGNRWHWVWLNEGELFTPEKQRAWFDHPNTVEALQWAYDMVNTYQVSPAPGAVQGGHRGNFISGVYAMMITSSSFVPELKQQGIRFVTHPGPPGPGKNGYRFSGATSSTLSIVSSTQHPKEAWTFLRWLVYEKGLEFAEERGGIPYLIEGLQSGKYRAQPWEAFATSILTYQPRNNYIYGVSEADWLPAFQAAWDAVIRGEGDARVMLQQAQEAVDARLVEIAQQIGQGSL